MIALLAPSVRAQGAAWLLVADGEAEPAWSPPPRILLDSAATLALAYLQDRGYWRATLDSAQTQAPRAAALGGTLFATRGEPVRVGAIYARGAPDSLALRDALAQRPGDVLDATRLRDDLGTLARDYEQRGLPLAAFRYEIGAPRFDAESETWRASVTVFSEPGPRLRLLRVEASGEGRTRGGYLARASGLRVGRTLAGYDPDAIQRRLTQTGYFRRVGAPELYVTPDSGAVVRIPVTEEAPGTFDLVLGLLPQATGGVQIVGNGRMELRNAFGAGRALRLRLDRLPGQVSRAEVAASDPFVAGTAFGASLSFQGAQQDSLYNQQKYRVGASYALGETVSIGVTASREVTRPGPSGLRLTRLEAISGARAQRIPTATSQFAGIELTLRRLDRPSNPRRGVSLELRAERGTKDRSQRQITQISGALPDTTSVRQRLAQERIDASARVFLPTLRRQLAAFGLDAGVLVSDAYDASDLYRFGGASSLRGYDEDRFLGRLVARALAEYRVQIDRESYAYAFVDVGYVDDPGGDERPSRRAFYPGYGVGIQFAAPVGLLVVTYALNPEESATAGRVHVGLSFGL